MTALKDNSAWRAAHSLVGSGRIRAAALLFALGLILAPEDGTAAERSRADFALARPDSALAEKLRSIEGDPLSLTDALALAVESATTSREAKARLSAARGALRREQGAFDPVLFAEYEIRGEDEPTASPFAGADVLETEERTGSAGVELRLPIGTELGATLETTRFETNSSFAFVDPQHTAIGRLDVRQPLLKGFGPSARSPLTSAERDLDAARSEYEDAILEVELDVTAAYWDLYAAERDYAVQLLIVERARAFLGEVETRSRAGLVGPSDVAGARVFLAQQELALLDREEELDEASDRLSSVLGDRPQGDLSRYRPTTEPEKEFRSDDLEELLERARVENRELRAAKHELESRRAEERGAAWAAFPTLDLMGSLGGNGLAGSGRTIVFGGDTLRSSVDGGFTDALGQVGGRDFPTWSVGVHFSVPIGFREGRGERDRLRGEVQSAETRVVEVERELEERTRAAHRRLAHASARLEVAEVAVTASLEQVRIAQIEFTNGRTTAFEITRLGADVAETQRSYSEALVRAAKAAAELERVAPSREISMPKEMAP
jgi:outer membrane protein TolC